MVIVSQDKEEIINFSNVTNMFVMEDGDIRAMLVSGNDTFIAQYEKKERAKEVLQEIVKKYSSYMQLNGGPAILQGQSDIAPAIFNIPKVYEMPEK